MSKLITFASAFQSVRPIHKSDAVLVQQFQSRLFVSPPPPERIAVVGGGLAGLSTTYHLLQKIDNVHITVMDKALPGQGGASSVAGG